jgi:hypothetical protein
MGAAAGVSERAAGLGWTSGGVLDRRLPTFVVSSHLDGGGSLCA